MSSPCDEIVLGVDAGGTKTLAWLATLHPGADDRPLGVGLAGPGNPRAVGFEETFRQIDAAVSQAFLRIGRERKSVAGACLCLAGAGRPEEQERIREWALSTGIAQRVRVTGDAEPILAATEEESGVALISGTGSFAWGRNLTGETSRAGGWGYLFGDEGSGYAIALAGLRAAVQSADGRAHPTGLLEAFLQALDANRPEQLVGRVYGRNLSREQIAGLARCVFECSENDETARAIVESAADDLARMVGTVARVLMLPANRYPLALAGGVLVGQPDLRDSIARRLSLHSSNVHVVEEPVRGAVVMARKLLNEGAKE